VSVLEAVQQDRVVLAPAAMARVNLLPPEIAERARFRRIQLGLGAGLVSAVAVVVALQLSAGAEVREAEAAQAAAASRGAELQAAAGEFAEVEAVYARAAAARAVLAEAMGQEVRFSSFLRDLSLTVPDDVQLADTTFTQAVGPDPDGGIGTVTFSGIAASHDDVAVWLETLAAQQGYANPTISGSTAEVAEGRRKVTFTSSVSLTPDALSHRYSTPAGG
jgi:Tfp pilus assembly protein PilN